MGPNKIPYEEKYRFYERAEALIHEWTPLLLADVHSRCWIQQGKYSLLFVAENQGICERREARRLTYLPSFLVKRILHTEIFYSGSHKMSKTQSYSGTGAPPMMDKLVRSLSQKSERRTTFLGLSM